VDEGRKRVLLSSGYYSCGTRSRRIPTGRASTAPHARKYRFSSIRKPWTRLVGFELVGNEKEAVMLYWALMFLLVAVVAAVFGFTGIAVASAGIAKLLFFVFLVLFVISLITHLGRRGSTRI
jgi:uncharacterized membrane protein YtjA (UPF0391 family)